MFRPPPLKLTVASFTLILISLCIFHLLLSTCYQHVVTGQPLTQSNSKSVETKPKLKSFQALPGTDEEDDDDDDDLEKLFGKHRQPREVFWSAPVRRVTSVSCMDLMEGNDVEIARAEELTKQGHAGEGAFYPKEAQLSQLLLDCVSFADVMGYRKTCHVTDEELEFPIAYSIIVHANFRQVEQLLRAIYRPHNHYCIHVDRKSNADFLHSLQSLATCFPNVFLTEKREDVVYGHFSRLQADLNCMDDLLQRNSTWKYLINLTGQMYPLKTNREIVKILSTLRHTNDIEGFSWFVSKRFVDRYNNSYEISKGEMKETSTRKPRPPFNLTLIKGSVFGSFTRDFVKYVLTNKRVRVFLEWLRDVYSPDEFFWSTVNSRGVNPIFNAPGAHDGAPERLPWLSTFASWYPDDFCAGKFVRGVCIFGVGDLQQLSTKLEMFANKFYTDFHPVVLACLEEWIHNKTLSPPPFPTFMYRQRRYYLHPGL